MRDLCGVILAAGEGKRFRSQKPKVLQEVLFKPLAQWVCDCAQEAGVNELCMVVGHLQEQVRAYFGDRCQYAVQEEQKGTGHAVAQAKEFLEAHRDGCVLVMYGDAPLLTPQTVRGALEKLESTDSGCVVISARVADPTGYGRIVRSDQGVTAIVEEKDANDAVRKIDEINSGTYWFRTRALLSCLDRFTADNRQGEYYLTQAVELLLADGDRVESYPAADPEEILGANNRMQQLELNQVANARILKKHMDNGVSFAGIDGVLIGPDVEIGSDTVILPGTILRGRTVIGRDCTIGPNSMVADSQIGDGVTLNATQVLKSSVGNGTTIGPFSQLRPNSHVGERVKIGNFVEVKNSEIGERTSVAHLTYVGDADVGSRVNFGCGTVTVNYDGKSKYRTIIGDNVFVGCNSNLVAPVLVEDGSYIAAGSTITDNVPADALAIARARQVNKEGWAKKKSLYHKD